MDSAVQGLSDLDLIFLVKNESDDHAFEELLCRHTGIYLNTLHKYAPKNSELINRDELIEDTQSNIYDAIVNYDPERGAKFSTYLGNSTRWRCLNTVNKNKKKPTLSIDFDATLSHTLENCSEESFVKNLTEQETCNIIDSEIRKSSDPRIKTIFSMRYFKDNNKLTSWRLIAEKLNLSIQGTIDIHDRFLEKIKKKNELQ
jgi:RNA polymerase sigma factor (sigma-70 family)